MTLNILIKFTICMFKISMENGDHRFKSANQTCTTTDMRNSFQLYID